MAYNSVKTREDLLVLLERFLKLTAGVGTSFRRKSQEFLARQSGGAPKCP